MKLLFKILISFCFAVSLSGQGKIIIKMATLAPEGSIWHGKLVEMGQKWSEVTDGKVILRIYPGGVVGDERDMIRKMRIGQIHAAAVTTEGLSELNPDVYALLIPLLFDNYEDVDWIRERLSDDLIKGINESGFEFLFWIDVGWAYWFTRDPIHYPEDLKSMKIFNWAGDYKTAEIWRKGGFHPVPLAAIDVLTGLQTGLIDAIGTNPIVALSSQYFGPAKHMLNMKWGLIFGGIVIDSRIWKKIDLVHQESMLKIANEIRVQQQSETRYDDQKAIDVMKEYGLVIHEPTDEEREHWKTYVKTWYPDLKRSFIPEEIFERVLQLKREKEELDALNSK